MNSGGIRTDDHMHFLFPSLAPALLCSDTFSL